MAEIIQEEKGGKGGKRKSKKHPPRIDMTPMVDLMCLLITFFMLTTAFSKSKVMEIILPDKVQDPNQKSPVVAASRTTNIILGPDNRIFYYAGNVKPEQFNDLPPLIESDYSADGVRKLLLDKNRSLARRIAEFNADVISGKIPISQDSARGSITAMKNADDTGPIVLIKAYKSANYGNFVDILDEMNICGIARYTFMKIAWYEEKMVENAIAAAPTASNN